MTQPALSPRPLHVSPEPNTNPPPAMDAQFEDFRAKADGSSLALREWMNLAERWRIDEALRACRGNRSAAARALGIGRRTLYAKMEKLGIASHSGPAST